MSSAEEFEIEEAVVPYKLEESSVSGVIPEQVETGTVENSQDEAGGDLVDSTQGDNSPQVDGEMSQSARAAGEAGSAQSQGSGLILDNSVESCVQGDQSSDEEQERFRSLNDIYNTTGEVVLQYDSDGEPLQNPDVEALLAESEEPNNYSEATRNPEWIEAMDKEIESIEKNGTWKLSKLPAGQKAIVLKWVF
jgi:hypothetical protein